MRKRVVIVASGETERTALPCLLRCLAPDIVVDEVRIPPRNKNLDAGMIERLIKAAWYKKPDEARPDKFVVLMDVDHVKPAAVLDPIQEELPGRLDGIGAEVRCAYAQQHLEAWYFADVKNLKTYPGTRSPGKVDTSKPDEIENPKHHLMQVLRECGIPYTAKVSGEIARKLDATRIAERSPSFTIFMDAVKNGSRGAAPSVATADSQEPRRSSGTSPRSWRARLRRAWRGT